MVEERPTAGHARSGRASPECFSRLSETGSSFPAPGPPVRNPGWAPLPDRETGPTL